MKGKRKATERTEQVKSSRPLSDTVRLKSGKGRKQYPASVGLHGTDPEKDLNPEE
ncbi:MAG TPA: hypothetical protein VFO54_05570 [Chryseosolibacter sp.]|nr:hypothetical protein [Chryseosolibacter sp.]